MDLIRNSKLQQTLLAHACMDHFFHTRANFIPHGSIRHADTAAMQVQLPQFRKAGLEVTAVFSRGQQRARQVAEQVSTPQHVAFAFAILLFSLLGLFTAKCAWVQNGIKHCFSRAEDLCLCEEGLSLLFARLINALFVMYICI